MEKKGMGEGKMKKMVEGREDEGCMREEIEEEWRIKE